MHRARQNAGTHIMIARRSFLMALWIGLALASVGAMAAEPSATSFVEAIYAPYKVKDGKGFRSTATQR